MLHLHAMHGGDPAVAAQQLSIMKAELKRALEEVEHHEQSLSEKLQPQTVDQVEELQGKLREALEELDRRKAELKLQQQK
jgi:peptidoglycan hydrolase CwlO-like protein